MAFPTLSQVEGARWDFLRANATAWSSLAHTWEAAFTEIRDASASPGGTQWTGAGAEAFQQRAAADVVKVRGAADLLVKAAGIASRGADTQDGNKQSVLDAVNAAEREDFHVGEFFSVTDTWTYYTSAAEQAERENEAQRHADFITCRVHTLANNEDAIARNLTTTTAGLQGFTLPDEGTDGGAGAVDNHTPRPPPQDPKQFAQWWNRLTQAEKDAVYDRDHFIGNHPGMPFEDKTHYNMDRHLPELMANAQSNADTMQARFGQLARQVYMGDHSTATGSEMAELGPKLQAAKHSLAEYQGVQQAMHADPDGPSRYLGYLDDHGRAAVSIGNPDTARRNAVLVPGTGQDLTTMSGAADKSLRMFRAAHTADPNLLAGDVAVTTWMAYDRPMDVLQAAHTSYAHNGAAGLDSFEAGMRASHLGAPSLDTVIGHSYGSTLVGAASTDGHHLAADNVIAVGSPGMFADCASGLDLNPAAQVFASRADNDIITMATGFTLGPDPTTVDFGAIRLAADPGPPGIFGIPGTSIAAHSSYWDQGNRALLDFGAVIAGVQPPYVVVP
ncbi:alpha/beta hydrolase [Mycolicibacter hiberniae]|uniref:DUF1023 domain-containing protein n=1 Tax=Mycolicibacter hiberniae TaxID=29314 RepID=A0A7I7X0W1_9MYCO|nr:alpha/beta hydrolase [Mycolicibacter hiberniae]MCV7084387.1 hypothetical protein [Mycolicibacter hiberniae]ORV67193.1 hypothetical protein AWC09_18560 [Mycolicibacter hiberniae]BBZ22920.1 hypothetical protein MHIB_13380 [Mycolicibacter hiberniae]